MDAFGLLEYLCVWVTILNPLLFIMDMETGWPDGILVSVWEFFSLLSGPHGMSFETREYKPLEELMREYEALREKMNEIDNKIFKIETRYFEITGPNPITHTVEHYICNKTEKKTPSPDERVYVFACSHPKVSYTEP